VYRPSSPVPTDIQDGTLVVGEQSVGLPLHKATLSVESTPALGFQYGANIVYEGLYNELNLPQYATLAAHVGYRFRSFELGLTGTNLTNVYDQRFTTPNGGVTYGGLGQVIPQDAYAAGHRVQHYGSAPVLIVAGSRPRGSGR
jgi:hypothetical protein